MLWVSVFRHGRLVYCIAEEVPKKLLSQKLLQRLVRMCISKRVTMSLGFAMDSTAFMLEICCKELVTCITSILRKAQAVFDRKRFRF